jgi:hypothetical protein
MLSEVQSGEAEGAGWRPMASWNIQGYVEMGVFTNHAPSTHNFKRWPDDPDTERLNIETSRSYRYDNSTGQNASIGIYFQAITTVTHHAITFSVAGNITDSAGGTVTIDLHRDSDGLLLGTTSRTGDGAYSLSWYDNTENVFVSAYENSTHLGRSTAGVAV